MCINRQFIVLNKTLHVAAKENIFLDFKGNKVSKKSLQKVKILLKICKSVAIYRSGHKGMDNIPTQKVE